jgi:hypothetical protein
MRADFKLSQASTALHWRFLDVPDGKPRRLRRAAHSTPLALTFQIRE